MIWHYNITSYLVAFFYKNIKPFVNEIITLCHFYKGNPTIACKCYKEYPVFLFYFSA